MFNDNTVITDITSIIHFDGNADNSHIKYSDDLQCCELIYIISGEAYITYDCKKYYETADNIRYMPKGKTNGYYVDTLKRGTCIDIFFEMSSNTSQEGFQIFANKNANIKNLFIKIQKIWSSKKSGYYHKCMSLIYEILDEFSAENEQYISNKQYKMIRPSIEYIEKNYLSKSFNYSQLHKLCGISYTYFKKLFVAKFGLTPVKYVNNLKIQYACDLLKSHLYKITLISELTGFENVYYFSKVFKQTIGVSPKNYMNSYR